MKLVSIMVALSATIPMCAASSYLYVANQSSNTVSKVDRTTNKVITTIPVPGGPTDVAQSEWQVPVRNDPSDDG